MKKISVFVFCIAFLLGSCQWYAINKYHLKKEFHFDSKKKYFEYLVKKNICAPNRILYLDSSHFLPFMLNEVMEDSSCIYLGCYVNDSIVIKKGTALSDNKSCISILNKEIKHTLSMVVFPDSICKKTNNLCDYKFKKLIDDRVKRFNYYNHKKNIFLFYNYAFGSYYDSLYKEMFAFEKNNPEHVAFYLICLDGVYKLKQ